MITAVDLGNRHSGKNLGNNLFQIASLYGLSKRYDTNFILHEDWKYIGEFELSQDIFRGKPVPDLLLKEPSFDYAGDFYDNFSTELKESTVDIYGYFQTEKYWRGSEDKIRDIFRVKPDTYNKVFKENEQLLTKEIVAVSVRRGDFRLNKNHYLLPFEYYQQALDKYFPGFDIVVFTDDYKWCRRNFSGLKNKVHYPSNYNAMEQLCFMSMFSNFIISNSTFSWWGAYLSSNKEKVVVRPYYVFAGEAEKVNDIKDYYPEEWICYRHTDQQRNFIEKFLTKTGDAFYHFKSRVRGWLYGIYVKIK